MADRVKLTLELDQATMGRIGSLVDVTGATSRTEVIRRALKLYEVMTDERRTAFIRNEDGSETRLLVV